MAASNLRTVRTATILSGASLSAAVKVGGDQIIAIQLPAAWTTANLTFQGSNDDTTFQNVFDDSGNELAVTAAAGRNVTLAVGLALGAFSSLKVRSGTSGSPVAQGADRAISLVTTSGRAATSIAPGGGAAVSMSDGANVTQGAIGDAAVTGDNTGTLSAKLRGILKQLVVQLPAALGGHGGLTIEGLASGTAVPVSAAALPLPTGASTSAKQPALGVAGTPSADVLTVQGSATGQPLPTGGTTVAATDVFTRPADTVAYAVGDSVSATVSDTGTTVLRGIAVAGANGGTGYITKIRLWTDQAACVAALRIHFYTVAAPPTAIPGDNVANGLFYGNFAKRIGSVDLPALGTETSGNTAAHTLDASTRLAFVCDPADTKLYYRLQTQTAFTPASGQSFSLELTSERNAT